MGKKNKKTRINVVFSTDPDYDYQYEEKEESETLLLLSKNSGLVWTGNKGKARRLP
jgi:hypothetical protein